MISFASLRLACLAASVLIAAVGPMPASAQQAVSSDTGNRIHVPSVPEQLGHGRTMKVFPQAHEAPSTTALSAATEHMHHAMEVPHTGDADADFVRTMIPHHEGAVEMARIVVQHGKDPDIRRLAEAIIAAQEAEIAVMQKWLDAHP